MKKPVIVHVITGLGVGGAERALYTLLCGSLNDRSHNYVISLTSDGYYGELLRQVGVPVYSIGIESDKKGLIGSLLGGARLIRYARKCSPDILQGWMYHGNFAASIIYLFFLKSVSLVWNIRQALDDPAALSRGTRLVNKILGKVSAHADVILSNSHRSRDQHVALGYSKDNFYVIPNGFDCQKWKRIKLARDSILLELGIAQESFVIGFVGRPDPAKNISLLFSAFDRVISQLDNAVLVCVGDGLDKDQAIVEASSQTFFVGHQKDISYWMSSFDILCLPSRWEGFPNVVGEAMACEVPCVVTDVGDSAYIVGPTGWVVSSDSVSDLTIALINAARAPESELKERGRAARRRIMDNFSLDSISGKYVSLYKSLLE